ncbi:hypothetical protein [Streptomyces sp. NPDC005336]|uniref:hypothetical protein n=1 Tax=Streptomyces sp. NPDC005336 TaxID=3157035 RepID=UPI0033A7E02E
MLGYLDRKPADHSGHRAAAKGDHQSAAKSVKELPLTPMEREELTVCVLLLSRLSGHLQAK